MEFVQIHIPTIQNWEVLGQKVTAKGDTFLDFCLKNWLAILIGVALVIGFLYAIMSKSTPEEPPQKPIIPPKSGN